MVSDADHSDGASGKSEGLEHSGGCSCLFVTACSIEVCTDNHREGGRDGRTARNSPLLQRGVRSLFTGGHGISCRMQVSELEAEAASLDSPPECVWCHASQSTLSRLFRTGDNPRDKCRSHGWTDPPHRCMRVLMAERWSGGLSLLVAITVRP